MRYIYNIPIIHTYTHTYVHETKMYETKIIRTYIHDTYIIHTYYMYDTFIRYIVNMVKIHE